MSHPDLPALIAARAPTRLVPGTVLVADKLHGPDRVVLDCPAAALLTAELRRRGLATTPGPLHLIDTIEESAHAATGADVVVPAAGGRVGLGVATAGGTEWHTARGVLADWASVLGDRSVLLAAPGRFVPGWTAPSRSSSVRWSSGMGRCTCENKSCTTLWVPKTSSVGCDLHLLDPTKDHRTGHARIVRRAPATALPRPHRHGHASAVTADEQHRQRHRDPGAAPPTRRPAAPS